MRLLSQFLSIVVFLGVTVLLPWCQRLSFNVTFFHLEICDAKR